MDNTSPIFGPAMPLWASIPALAVFAVLLFGLCVHTKSTAGRLLLFSIWMRYNLSAFPLLSFRNVGGLSINAWNAILTVIVGALLLRRRSFAWMASPPILLICSLVLVSAIANGTLTQSVSVMFKYFYLLIIASAFVEAADDIGTDAVLDRVIAIFAVPLVDQLISIALRLPKITDGDESAASYIGGFNHESGFAIVLLTGLMVTSLHRRMHGGLKAALCVIFLAGIQAANYRTVVVAAAPLLVMAIVQGTLRTVVLHQRMLLVGLGSALVAIALLLIPEMVGQRFADFGDVFSRGFELIKPQYEFSHTEKMIMSARLYIWAGYFDGWATGSELQKWIGHGADSWTSTFPKYAHNELISQMYDLGTVGMAAIAGMWLWMLAISARIDGVERNIVFAAHLTFIVLSMSTMPMYQVEGIILYGLLCGATCSLAARRGRSAIGESDGRVSARLGVAS